ncbi:T9SS type A sorting domain-containing protein [Flavivirga spongiicola]|uniref:T9SS type A sorting domain-containing protein n=1 Tax=Flavivirga spongiicola TaxID=421621 RepID=A0ABU7XTU2_9FLAO|nr:T9SS type A sorting domain-containing protein [Flavivirga sp. MEBiC05379]MDO5978917.1 T9SS type A sorting domain-containing protein [Flavivirga sp. MEBiC05379]
MKQCLLIILMIPFLSFCQVQIGNDIDGEAAKDQSGYNVSLSSNGSIVAIGAIDNKGNGIDSGHVRIYENLSGVWTQIGDDIDGEVAGVQSGFSVSLSSDGSVVAIGAPYNSGNGGSSGHVRIYENLSGVWTQVGNDIDGERAGDLSGFSVSLSSDGSIVAIGAPLNDDNGIFSGHVRIYENLSGVWTQIGDDINGETVSDYLGWSISLSSDGSKVAMGAIFNDGIGIDSGHVRIYENLSGVWTQIGDDIDGEATGDQSGFSVSLSSDGSVVAIGAFSNDGNGEGSGHVRIYKNLSGVWTQIGEDIDGEAAGDLSGSRVSLSSNGSIVAINAVPNDGNGEGSGHVRIYKNLSGVWTQIGEDIDGEAAGDSSGSGLSLSSDGTIVAIGAYGNDNNGEDSGHVRVYDLSAAVLSSNTFVLPRFSISPNPTINKTTINLRQGLMLEKVNIYNNLGQFIDSINIEVIDTSNLSKGLYYIEVVTDQGKATKKLVIE